MKIKFKLASCLTLAASMVILSNSAPVMAKELQLHEQPKADAKVIAKIDTAAGVIPIYAPKDGQWVKIADPRNGNVGWVKSSELAHTNSSRTTFRLSQETVNEGKAPVSYQIIQFGEPGRRLTTEQAQAIVKKMRMQQEAMHKSMRRMMYEMNYFFDEQWGMMDREVFPVILPVVVYPDHHSQKVVQAKPEKSPQKATESSPPSQVKTTANSLKPDKGNSSAS